MNKVNIEIKYSDKEAQTVAAVAKIMEPTLAHLVQTLVFSAETEKELTIEYIQQIKKNLRRGFEDKKGWIVHEIRVTI